MYNELIQELDKLENLIQEHSTSSPICSGANSSLNKLKLADNQRVTRIGTETNHEPVARQSSNPNQKTLMTYITLSGVQKPNSYTYLKAKTFLSANSHGFFLLELEFTVLDSHMDL